MRFYWKCEDCDSENLYPDVTVCETCEKPMSAAEEKRVLQQMQEYEQQQEALRLEAERKRREEELARQEAERKRLAELEAARRAEEERKRKAEIERKLRLKLEPETKFCSIYSKTARILCAAMRIAAILAIVAGVVLAIANSDRLELFADNLYRLSANMREAYQAHTVLTDSGESGSRLLHNLGDILPAVKGVFSNVGRQAAYLWDSYTPVENITRLIADISEFLSGGK